MRSRAHLFATPSTSVRHLPVPVRAARLRARAAHAPPSRRLAVRRRLLRRESRSVVQPAPDERGAAARTLLRCERMARAPCPAHPCLTDMADLSPKHRARAASPHQWCALTHARFLASQVRGLYRIMLVCAAFRALRLERGRLDDGVVVQSRGRVVSVTSLVRHADRHTCLTRTLRLTT